jgi:23S rRNA (guanosine2251-2'-O)-methyltransferase
MAVVHPGSEGRPDRTVRADRSRRGGRSLPGGRKAPDAGQRSRPALDIIYGKHSVRAVFRMRPGAVRRVVMREGAARYLEEFIELAGRAGIEPELLRTGDFLRLAGLDESDRHQGLFVMADPLPVHDEHDLDLLSERSVVLVLDQVSNPQNFGAIIRTAAFFGVEAVVWLKNRAVDVTPTVTHVAVGGTEFVKLFRVTNLARSLELLKERGFWIYGLDERGDGTVAETRFDPRSAVVIGAEGEGMRQRTRSMCDEVIRIPGAGLGIESLNAGVAAAIVMAEIAGRASMPAEAGQKSAR